MWSGGFLLGNAIFTRCITSPSILPIGKGGTGATTISEARTNLAVMTETVLYNNLNGTNSTITLSDSISNYSKISLFYYTESTNECAFYVEFDARISSVLLCSARTNDAGSMCFIKSFKTVCSGNTISFFHGYQTNITAQASTFVSDNASIKIYKVVGYKY